jgi:hypothetical protein
MSKFRKAVLLTPLLVATSILPGIAQNHHNNNDSAYYNGMRNGTRGGDYYNNRDPHYNNNYNNNRDPHYDNNYNYHNDHRQGGIGPGKGALIGGAGGAVLGAVFGGGLKGSLIGGAAGAGIGAVIGQANQNKRNNDNYQRPY